MRDLGMTSGASSVLNGSDARPTCAATGRASDRIGNIRLARRLPVIVRAAGILVIAILGLSPWLGWWPLLFVVTIMSGFALADLLMPRLGRPEFLMFASWVASGVAIAVAVAVSGTPGLPALSWLAIPVITLSSRFSMRGVVVGVCISIALALAVAFAFDAHAVLHNPTVVAVPLVLILCVAVLSTPLMRSDIQHRSDAVIDQLTGMLNRKALVLRVEELTQQARMTVSRSA
jgi:hypothetical protein